MPLGVMPVVNPAPITTPILRGQCGPANGKILTKIAEQDLCLDVFAGSLVADTNGWRWNCGTAICSANFGNPTARQEKQEDKLDCVGKQSIATGVGSFLLTSGLSNLSNPYGWAAVPVGSLALLYSYFTEEKNDPRCVAAAGLVGGVGGAFAGGPIKDALKEEPKVVQKKQPEQQSEQKPAPTPQNGPNQQPQQQTAPASPPPSGQGAAPNYGGNYSVPITGAPVGNGPAVYNQPAPIYNNPAPVYNQPTPVYAQPTVVPLNGAPVGNGPAMYNQPAPIYNNPALVNYAPAGPISGPSPIVSGGGGYYAPSSIPSAGSGGIPFN